TAGTGDGDADGSAMRIRWPNDSDDSRQDGGLSTISPAGVTQLHLAALAMQPTYCGGDGCATAASGSGWRAVGNDTCALGRMDPDFSGAGADASLTGLPLTPLTITE